MTLSFAPPRLPATVRVCRALLWTQAALAVFSGIFVLLVTHLYGTSDGVSFNSGSVAGASATVLAVGYLAVAAALGAFAGALRSRVRIVVTRALVGFEVLLAAAQLYRAAGLSSSSILPVALCVAVVALILMPASRRPVGTTHPA